ncbi:MAG: hypothetical protein ACKPCP_09075 [Sphaerospermopsis kisseleviana]
MDDALYDSVDYLTKLLAVASGCTDVNNLYVYSSIMSVLNPSLGSYKLQRQCSKCLIALVNLAIALLI